MDIQPRNLSSAPAAVALVVAVLALAPAYAETPAAGGDASPGLALIARATELESLKTGPGEPVMLRAKVKLLRIWGWKDNVAEGSYSLMVGGPGKWRGELRFPGWAEVNGQSDGTRWRQRAVQNKPMRMFQAIHTADLATHLHVSPDAKVGPVNEETVAGRPAQCVDVERGDDESRSLCFDSASGLLVLARRHKPEAWYEYEGLIEAAGRRFPSRLRCTEGSETAVEVETTELTPLVEVDSALFAAPAGAETWPACPDPEPPRVVAKKAAKQPVHAKATRQFGTVMCIAEVGTDGYLHDIAVVQSRGGMLDRAVKSALEAWQWEPAKCGGVPVPYEVSLKYTFMP